MDQQFSTLFGQLGSIFAALGVVVYAGLLLWLASLPRARVSRLMPSRAALVAAVAGVMFWAAAWAQYGPESKQVSVAELVRNLCFIIWLVITFSLRRDEGTIRPTRIVLVTLVVINLTAGLLGGLALIEIALGGTKPTQDWVTPALMLVDMVTASGGLILIESSVRRRTEGLRMPVLVVAGGIATLWAYSLNIHLLGALAGRPPETLILIEPLLVLLVLPTFILVAVDTARDQVRLSRSIAFRTLALAGLAAYLVIIALVGALARLIGGDYGNLAQGVLLSSAVLLGGALTISTRARGWISVMISKHFFEHRYDYRTEWMRFTATLEGGEDAADAPFRRVARALAKLADSPAAVVLLPDSDGNFRSVDHWHWPMALGADFCLSARSAFMLHEAGRVIALDQLRDQSADAIDAALPIPAALLADRAAWVLLPLQHLGRLVGVAVLQRPHAPRSLDWEDFDVLRISSRQAASHIAEMQSQSALSEARRFDEFNRRFAFIMHDVKNLASQLGLLAVNAERHAENPEFRADMIETLKLSVARMNDLLHRLSAKGVASAAAQVPVSISPLMEQIAHREGARHKVTVSCDTAVAAQGDRAAISQILGHLVANAIDASPADIPILLSATSSTDHVQIDVVDGGTGMSPAFVRNELFKPFVSTKDNGFGLGAFEALQLARSMGARLEVDSREGEGTRFSLILPRVGAAETDKQESRAA